MNIKNLVINLGKTICRLSGLDEAGVTCRSVSPLLDKIRTASRLKSSLCLGAIFGLLYVEWCLQKIGTQPLDVQATSS